MNGTRDLAAAYDLARRMVRAKAAFGHLQAVALKVQAQALRIEARRLRDAERAAPHGGGGGSDL